MKSKSIALKFIWGCVLACWIGMLFYRTTGPDIKSWTMAVTGTAIVTEIGFWLTAALLGMGIWESRKRVFEFIAKPFKKVKND